MGRSTMKKYFYSFYVDPRAGQLGRNNFSPFYVDPQAGQLGRNTFNHLYVDPQAGQLGRNNFINVYVYPRAGQLGRNNFSHRLDGRSSCCYNSKYGQPHLLHATATTTTAI